MVLLLQYMPYLGLTQRSTNSVLSYSGIAEISCALPALYQPWPHFTAAYFSSLAFFRRTTSLWNLDLPWDLHKQMQRTGVWRNRNPLSPFGLSTLCLRNLHGVAPSLGWTVMSSLSSHTQFCNHYRLREGRSNAAQLVSSNLFRHRNSVAILSLYTHILS